MKRAILFFLLTIPAFSQFGNANRIQSRPVSPTAPTNAQAMIWKCTVPSPVFTGAGLNDASSGGTCTTDVAALYEVVIDSSVASPDTFKWRKDGGSYTTGVSMTGSAQTLSDGVTITFKATDGHTLANAWAITTTVAWGPGTSIGGTPSGAAGGALAGTYPNPTLAYTATNPQTGTSYAILTSDRGKLVTFTNASPIAVSIAAAGSTGFPDGWETTLLNSGVGTLTLTPTTSTVEGQATLVLTTGQSATITSNGTNYRVQMTPWAPGSTGVYTTGNVGIGTTSPAAKLEVNGEIRIAQGSGVVGYRSGGGTSALVYLDPTADNLLLGHAQAYLGLRTGLSERVRIDSTGNVGIGTIVPTTLLSLPTAGVMGWETSTGVAGLGLSKTSIGRGQFNSGTSGKWGGLDVGSLYINALSSPGAPTVTPTCAGTCVSTWTYTVEALAGDSTTTVPGATGTTALNATTLDATHYNTITWSAVTGASTYTVRRTVSGGTPATLGALTTCTGISGLSCVDNNLVGDAGTAPAFNTTGSVWNGSTLIGRASAEVDANTSWGYSALSGNTGSNVTASGVYAAYQNTGPGVTANGDHAAYLNTGSYVTANGGYAAYLNTGSIVTASGLSAAQQNTGSSVTASGGYAAYLNTGSNVVANGYSAAKQNTGSNVTASGVLAAYLNTGPNVTANGYNAAFQNNWPNLTVLGFRSSEQFVADAATDKTFTDAEVDGTAHTITYGAAHGFGTVGGQINLLFTKTAGTTSPAGLVTGTIYYFTVTSTTVLTLAGITDAGSGDFVGKLTNSVDIHDSIAIGVDTNPTKAHQAVLGPSGITETVLRGNIIGSPGGSVPAWAKYTATLHPSTWTTCTSASPIECTMTAHGLPTGASTVWVAGGTGDWAGVNGARTVTWVSTTKYTIPIDGSLFAAFGAQAITARSWGVSGYQDVAAADTTTQDLPILALPGKWQVTDWAIKPTTRCTGPTTIKTGLGTAGSTQLFRAQTFDLDTVVADTNLSTGPTAGAGANTAAATTLVLSLISTGTNINAVSACVIEVSVLWGVRP